MRTANRILGTLGHRGWRVKRAWALSHAWDWWRADCSRRLVMGSLRRVGAPGLEREETGAAPSPRLGPPPPAELAVLGVLVSFPPVDGEEELSSPALPDQPPA